MFSIKIIWLLFIVVIQASKCYTFEQYQQQQQPFYERIPSQQFRNQYQYPDVNYNHNNNGELNTNCANNFKNPPYAGSSTGNNNAYNAFNGYPMFPYKTDLQSHKFNGYKSNTYNNDMPRKSKFEEDYITYDTKNKGNNGRGNDNNKYEQQYDEKSHKDLSKEYYKDEKDLSNKKADEVKPNDLGSFVKGTYDENYYKTEKRQKRNTPKHDELINAHLLDFNDNNTPNVDFNRQKLSNINSNPKSNGNKEFLLDYVMQRIIFRSIRNMLKKRIIQKSYSTNTLVQAVFNNCIKNTDLYKILISNATDNYGISETFNDYKRWKEIVGVDVYEPNEVLIGIILESLIRDTFQWLCENNLIISRYNVEMITNEAFELMKQTNFYQTLLHPEESNSVLNIINRNNWWLLEGDIWTEGNVKRWSWKSLK